MCFNHFHYVFKSGHIQEYSWPLAILYSNTLKFHLLGHQLSFSSHWEMCLMIPIQSLVKHLLLGPSAPLIELSFQHRFNFCSSCPLIISQMWGCRRGEQQSLTAEPLLPSAHSAWTSFPQLITSPLHILPDPSFWFLLDLSPGREASLVAQTRCLFHGLHWQWLSFLCLLSCAFSLARLTQIKTLAKIWEFAVSHGLAFLSSFFRLELELIISVYS